jgi:hypothetical protein
VTPVDRPLALGELLAETTRLYSARFSAALGLGAVVGGALFVGILTGHVVGFVGLLSVTFTAAYAVAARLVSGDRFGEAWAQVALRAPVLLVLTLVVSLPFAIGRIDPVLFIFAVLWLALMGFSIPVAVVERDYESRGSLGQLGFALWRSVSLARAEYLHALGVAAALAVSYVLFSALLAGALAGFAENSERAASVLAQIVLAPFFFLGLAVLYFEQRARAVSSPRPRS